MFRGNFQVLNMRWQVQKLVFVTPADMIDQKNQLKQVAQRQKYSKTAVEVEKKNIRPGQCQPYVARIPPCTPMEGVKNPQWGPEDPISTTFDILQYAFPLKLAQISVCYANSEI